MKIRVSAAAGFCILSNDDNELTGWAKWRDFARSVGVTTHMLSAEEANERGKATGRKWKGGVFSPTDGTADPSKAVPVAARAIMAAGRHGTPALRRSRHRAQCQPGDRVVTETGTIRTKTVVMAGGAWASSFCNQFGIRFPQASVRQSILAVAPGAAGLPDALHTALVSLTRRSNGGTRWQLVGARELIQRRSNSGSDANLSNVRSPLAKSRPGSIRGHARKVMNPWRNGRSDEVTPMELNRTLNPRPDMRQIRLTHQRACELLPELRRVAISNVWAGYIDSTPDGVPAIGEVGGDSRLYPAAGFSGHGFGIGPGAGI